MLRENFLAQAACLCVATWLFIACDSDPAFDVNEQDPQASLDGEGQGPGDLDANAQGGAAGPAGCVTDEGTPCELERQENTTGDDTGGVDGGGDTDGGDTAGTTGGTAGGDTAGTTSGDTGGTTGDDTGGTTGGDTGGTTGGDTAGTTGGDTGGTTGGDTGGTTGGDTGGTTGGDTGGTTGGDTDGGITLQGNSETFTVEGDAKPVDLVLTVDNSGSMAEEQAGLAQKIVDAFSHIQGSEFRVALMTTDRNQGIQHFVDSASPGTFEEKMAGLKSAIAGLGISGSGTERGFEQSITGLNADNPAQAGNQTWLRNGSVVAALIVSDEDNCSDGCGTANSAWIQAEFTAMGRTSGDDARIYGIIRRNAGECTSAAAVGDQYMEGISATNGLAGAICDADYGPTLQQISADIGVIANTTFELAHAPYQGTVQVWINGVQYMGNSEVNANRVTLTDATLAPQDEVYIQYSYVVN